MEAEVKRLLDVYNEHGKIIVGLDFDDTVFPLNDLQSDICFKVRQLILGLQPDITICLYTISDAQSLKYKLALLNYWDIYPDYINESPVKFGDCIKPYFNILLDDKAGLPYTLEVLTKFKKEI